MSGQNWVSLDCQTSFPVLYGLVQMNFNFELLYNSKEKKADVKLNNREIQEIPGGRKFLRRRPVLTANHRVFRYFIY